MPLETLMKGVRAMFSAASTYGHLTCPPDQVPPPTRDLDPGTSPATAVLAGGCFWCTEAVFKAVDGILGVRSGYTGDTAETADYRTVCTGRTNHAEAIELTYDPATISFGRILQIFFTVAHDPTQKNRQGGDVGPQYRSAIFYSSADEQAVARAYIAQLEAAGVMNGRIQTTLEPLDSFFEAEDYHQDFAARNPHQPYIQAISQPKVGKLKKYFDNLLKSEAK